MKRFLVKGRPGLIATAAAALTFLLMLLLAGPLDKYFAHRALELESSLLLRGFNDAMDAARTELSRLPSFDNLNCDNGMSIVLGRNTFENPYVRWLAVLRGDEIICRGTRVGINISPERSLLRIDNEWSFLMVRSPADAESLMLVQNRGDLQYAALFEQLLFDFLNGADCHQCVTYNLALGQNSEIYLRSGKMSGPAAASYTVDQVQRYGRLKLTLSGTQEYIDNFRFYGWLWATVIATLVAAAVGLMVYGHLIRRASLSFLIKQGLKRREFLPYYQPIVDSRDGKILGAEMLARWRTNDGNLVSPALFIPMAEQSGLIEPITDQLLEQTLVDIARFGWLHTDRYLSINAVPHQITDSSLSDKLLRWISEGKLSANNITVEITERHQFPDLARGKSALTKLVQAGIEIHIDDAGTGFGGFMYVQELPIQTLKIDKMFIDTLKIEGDAKRDVLDAIVEFARISGLKTVAEGVETHEQVEHLQTRNVYTIQGYVYAPPMPAAEFIRWTTAWVSSTVRHPTPAG